MIETYEVVKQINDAICLPNIMKLSNLFGDDHLISSMIL